MKPQKPLTSQNEVSFELGSMTRRDFLKLLGLGAGAALLLPKPSPSTSSLQNGAKPARHFRIAKRLAG